jgi:hypothetical protein
MKIEWKIEKKRGNYRPVLKYGITLEDFEVDLAVPQVVLEEALPCPPSAWRSFCYPGQDERADTPTEWHRLVTPSHKQGTAHGELTLPWRGPEAGFDDVREAFERLRRDFEAVLVKTHDSSPLDIVENLELSEETRKHIAVGVASARFLSAVGF